jgi:hypothetical protein
VLLRMLTTGGDALADVTHLVSAALRCAVRFHDVM